MRRLVELWQQYWFAPNSPTSLGVCRCLFFAVVFWQFGQGNFSARAELDPVFWFPLSFFRLFESSIPSAETLEAVQVVWRVSLVLSCLGLLTRISTIVSWVGGVYLLGLLNCFGKISHQPQMIVLILGILAVSRCGDAFSIDSLMRRRIRRTRLRDDLGQSGLYTWPVRLVWLVFVSVFFAAGVAKLRVSGLEWVLSDNMSNVLIVAHYGTENTWNELGLWVAQHHWLCLLIAAGSLALELLCPLALFSRWARLLLIPGLFLMQAGIFVLMGTSFLVFMAAYVFWVPWDRWQLRVTSKERSDGASESEEKRQVERRLETASA